MQTRKFKPTFIILIFTLLIGGYLLIDSASISDLFLNTNLLILRLRELKIVGPLLVMGLMALAIVLNPLPSAPVALASGAVYGHTLGTVYIITGAEIGAVIAFMIARLAGFELVQKYIGKNELLNRFTSQNALMAIIFASRLIPFLSFDLVSYGAGLTPVTLWRFAVATLLGLIPVSFLLAHYGGKMVGASFQNITLIVLVIGLITLAPILIKAIKKPKQNQLIDDRESEK